MRQRAAKSAATSPLHTLIAVVPAEALRPLVLALVLNGSGAGTPQAEPPAGAPRRRPGWPKGKPRGPRKAAIAKADVDAASLVDAMAHNAPAAASPKLAARHRHNASRRAKRAAARQGKGGCNGNGNNGKPGNGGSAANAGTPSAQALWKHAEALQPKTPWRAVAHALGINEALTLDCYRSHSVPPGILGSAIERFLALPTA
jgi:hypothetical protein